MHRYIHFVLVAAFVGAPLAHADEGSKRLSLQVSFGVKPDMAGLGATIAQDGTVDTADTTMANLLYSTGQALMSDRNNLVLWHNSQNTDSSFRLMGEEPELGGSLLGLDIGASAQYELDDVISLPLYVRGGFYYTTRIAGGSQRRVLGDVAMVDPTVAGLLQANGENPADYVGGVMETDYDASWLEIPLSVGMKVRFKDEQSFVYGGLGVSFFQGGFSVHMDVDENYANVLGTHIDVDNATVTNYSPGAVDETVDFKIGTMGLNWHLGAQTKVAKNAVIFFELNSSGAAKTVYSSSLSPELRRLLTATSSASLAESDPEWFKRLAFPVVTSGPLMRVGLRYYLY